MDNLVTFTYFYTEPGSNICKWLLFPDETKKRKYFKLWEENEYCSLSQLTWKRAVYLFLFDVCLDTVLH